MLPIVMLLGRLLAEVGDPVPQASDRGVLFIKREAVVDTCSPDAGTDAGGDAGSDAGTDADAGVAADAGIDDAGVPDAGMPDAGGDAGVCGLTTVKTITMVVQPELALGADKKFALLYVTPSRAMVATQPGDVFTELARVTAPMVEHETEYVEDPDLGEQCTSGGCFGGPVQQKETSGCGGTYYEASSWTPPSYPDGGDDNGGLDVEMIGPYEVLRVQPADTAQLTAWLDQLGYAYLPADVAAIAPYLSEGYHVVAARMAPTGAVTRRLTPLAMTWAGEEIRVPAALGRAPNAPTTSLTVYIASDERYELPNATIDFARNTSYGATSFLTRNDITLDVNQPASADPVATPNGSWEYREVHVVTDIVRVPVSVNCDDGCCSSSKRRQHDFGLIGLAVVVALRRRRRR